MSAEPRYARLSHSVELHNPWGSSAKHALKDILDDIECLSHHVNEGDGFRNP